MFVVFLSRKLSSAKYSERGGVLGGGLGGAGVRRSEAGVEDEEIVMPMMSGDHFIDAKVQIQFKLLLTFILLFSRPLWIREKM